MTESAPTDLTWPGLLAYWTDFAKASVALPKDDQGERWRESVAPIIALQAVTMALGDLDRLAEPDERPLALDRADMSIREHAGALHEVWANEPMSMELVRLIEDARRALNAAKGAGAEWCVEPIGEAYPNDRFVARHPADLAGVLLASGFTGDLMVAAPGVALFEGCPACFARDTHGGPPSDDVLAMIDLWLGEGVADPAGVEGPRQAYRQFDFAQGGPTRDLVLPMDETLPPGQPLLVMVIERGEAMPVSLPPKAPDRQDPLPVVFGPDEPGE